MKTFCVVGHDARQRAAAQTLQAAGFRIIGPEAACQADFVLLPMSQERVSDAVARTLQGVRPGTLLLAGRPGSPIQAAARQASLPLLDYFQRPELECLNAVPTAEGCLALLLQLRRRTIWESDFLVLGYGRIGRAVARRLDLLGGHTTVAARNAVQRANARCAGHRAAPLDRLPVLLAKHGYEVLGVDRSEEMLTVAAEKAMELLGGNIRRFVACREDIEAAENMIVGSLFAGIAFSFARLGNVHAMSHPISAYFDVPHGVANAVLLPVIAEYNALADHGRYFKIFNYISPFKVDAGEFEPGLLPGAIRELCGEIGIPNGIVEAVNNASRNGPVSREAIEEKIEAMAADAMKSGNIAVNPRASRQSDIEVLYRRAL